MRSLDVLKWVKAKALPQITFRRIIILLLIGIIGFSLFQVWDTNNNYLKEKLVRDQMAEYKPELVEVEAGKTMLVNQSIVDAQSMNPDIIGWIFLDGTRLDYPFVKSTDNDFYLRRDINRAYSYAGTVFMEYMCKSDFSDFSSIIYGHNMENGTMFSDLKLYNNVEFFNENKTGRLYLKNATYGLEVVAYMPVKSDNQIIYGIGYTEQYDKEKFLSYVKENAPRYRELNLTTEDKILVLSTCTNTNYNARSVLIVKLAKIS